MSNAKCIAALCAGAWFALLGSVDAARAEEAIPAYTARYDVQYKGRHVGESVHTLEPEGDGYRFRSVTEAQGIARLLRRQPIVEESLFELRDGSPRPLEFRLDDGTRKGEDDVTIDFDWASGAAHVVTEDGSVDLPLAADVHDRATLQLELMLDLAAQTELGSHALIDDASVKTYTYEVEGQETLDTLAGTYDTIKVVQRREGSSRHTIIWLAPELRHLPVKIEQRRDDEILTTLLLESAQGLSDDPADGK